MDYQYLMVSQGDNGIETLTVNRPDALNAMNSDVVSELIDYFSAVEERSEVKAVILTGAGEKAFIAGADIKEMADLSVLEGRKFAERGHKLTKLMQYCRKPVIAAVNGYALGGGCELALSCHLRFASANALFGQPEVGLGIIPGWGGTQRLMRVIGPGKATEMIISGKRIDASAAKQLGLVNEVYTPKELLPQTTAFLEKVLQQGPRAVALSLEAINHGMNLPLDEGLELEANLFGMSFGTEDMREGTQAFIQKRKPEFKNK